MRIAQQRTGLHLKVQPVRMFIFLCQTIAQTRCRNLRAGNFSQRFVVAHQRVQPVQIGAVVGFRLGHVNVETAAARRKLRQNFLGLDHEGALGQQYPILVHQ